MTNVWNGVSDNVSFSVPTYLTNNAWGGTYWGTGGATSIPAVNCFVYSTWTGTKIGNVINLYGAGYGYQNQTANLAYSIELDCSFPNFSNSIPNIGISTFVPKSITCGGTTRFYVTGSTGFVILNAELVGSSRFRLNWSHGTNHTASYNLASIPNYFDVHISGTIS